MAEYTASVYVTGQGRIKFESDTMEHACEDAQHMDIEDVDWTLYDIKVENVHRVPEKTEAAPAKEKQSG